MVDQGKRRRAFITRQLAQLEEDLAAVELDMATAPTELARNKAEKKAEQILDKIEQRDTELGQLDSDDLEHDAANNLGIVLRSFSFEVVTLGGDPDRETKQGQLYEERLGDDGVLEMVSIPAGRFMMGSPEAEPARVEREGPQHEVEVPAFFMGRYPVTQAQWLFVASNLPEVERGLEPEPSGFKGKTLPVEQVSWDDAIEFCQRLSQYTQKTYRLPSEAEWEYACRAGTTSPFHFGDTISPDIANYHGPTSYNGGPTGEYRQKTVPVNHFQIANRFGLSDMHGNVWEWCEDHWHENYRGSPPDDGGPWLEDSLRNNRRVRRGGSWLDGPWDCRSAYRVYISPDPRYIALGLRVVASAPFGSAVPQGWTL